MQFESDNITIETKGGPYHNTIWDRTMFEIEDLSGIFIQVEDTDKVVVYLQGDPYTYYYAGMTDNETMKDIIDG